MFSDQGIQSLSLIGPEASWASVWYHATENDACYVLVWSGHGTKVRREGQAVGTAFWLWRDGRLSIVYDQRYYAPAAYHGYTVEDLGLGPKPGQPTGSPKMKLIWFDCCYLGTLWPPSDPMGTDPSAMAVQFGMYSGAGDQAYVGFREIVHASDKIGFTDTFFHYVLGDGMSVEGALYATIDLRYYTHTERCENVRAQGNSPTDCYIVPVAERLKHNKNVSAESWSMVTL